MSASAVAQQKAEEEMVDCLPTKKHMETGRDTRNPPLKHQKINLLEHLGRLRIAKNKGRNDNPPTKLKKPKARELK